MAKSSPKAVTPVEKQMLRATQRLALTLRNWGGLIAAFGRTVSNSCLTSLEDACRQWESRAIAVISGTQTISFIAKCEDHRENAIRDAQSALAGLVSSGDLPNLPDEVLAGLVQLDYLRNEAFDELFVWRWQYAGRCPLKGKWQPGPLLRYYMTHIVAPQLSDAEDVLQELHVRLLHERTLDTYHPAKAFKPWFWRVAHNHMLDQMRRENLRFTISTDDDRNVIDPHDTVLEPQDQAILNEERRRLLEALRTLPPDQKRLVRLRLQGSTFEEIGRKIGLKKRDPEYKERMQREVYQPCHRGMRTLKNILT